MATRLHEIEQHDRQELRVAVVMDGGVSLAICMGGVTKEIDGAATADTRNSPDLLGVEPRVDVAGVSAGRVNGSRPEPRTPGTETDDGRDLWTRHSGVDPLLRNPLTRKTRSFSCGDDRGGRST